MGDAKAIPTTIHCKLKMITVILISLSDCIHASQQFADNLPDAGQILGPGQTMPGIFY